MDWFIELLRPGNMSLASTVLLYSFVIFAGIFLGKVKILGVSLGVTFVLFVGILLGHFGYAVEGNTLHFLREFGLILFIFSIGMQVGPGFFSSFKEGGIRMNMLAVTGIALNVVIMLSIYYLQGGADGATSITDMIGVMCGAITNTPALGAAQQTVLQVNSSAYDVSQQMSMGYAAAYPLGVVGIILTMILIKVIFKVNIDDEIKEVDDEKKDSTQAPAILTYKVTNELVSGLSMVKLHTLITCDYTCSRILKPDGKVVIPTAQDTIEIGDLCLIVCAKQDEEIFSRFIGQKVEMTWPMDKGPVVSRRIVVTQPNYNGVKLGALHLHETYELNVTRVNRAGMDLLASPNLRLQIGDRVTVVGKLDDIEHLARKLGNSMKRLNEPNLITMFIGIFLGIILGSLPIQFPGMSVPMKLGLAGGPLVVAILIGAYGHKFHLVTYTNSAANLLLREIGICLFLASVGIAAGKDFAATVFNFKGAMWVAYGFLITVIPLIVVGCIARGKFKMNYLSILGMMSGSYTDPPALAYANKVANNDAPAVAYSTVYPLTMFMRVIVAQVIVLCFL
ncbi:putative transporter [Lepagella muris]|jgi:putative transport protein|uniref:Transporter n=1 Tax=Lepagella muris TaxID=3032870 RepID=A0AC61REA7_9BACT|nr:putative transporter [Lepagella muris]ROT03617.1 putative transporter [Muribaculaceae bacterium Isolate-037 (Harlan)]TGY77283.1 putative transporter [Lepagella muris]THG49488.1 putative transporter [Bacteroidales bacterium]TKC54767.1 putative transporter [Bacteroidales bacterium]